MPNWTFLITCVFVSMVAAELPARAAAGQTTRRQTTRRRRAARGCRGWSQTRVLFGLVGDFPPPASNCRDNTAPGGPGPGVASARANGVVSGPAGGAWRRRGSERSEEPRRKSSIAHRGPRVRRRRRAACRRRRGRHACRLSPRRPASLPQPPPGTRTISSLRIRGLASVVSASTSQALLILPPGPEYYAIKLASSSLDRRQKKSRRQNGARRRPANPRAHLSARE